MVSYTDVTLTDENTSVVDGFGKALFVDLGLKTAFQKLLGGKLKNVIKLKLVIGEKTVTRHPSEKGGSLKDTLRILRVKGEKGTGGLSEFGQSVLDPPDLALASESVFTN